MTQIGPIGQFNTYQFKNYVISLGKISKLLGRILESLGMNGNFTF